MLGHFLAITEIRFIAADWISGLPLPRFLIMVLMIFVSLLGGSFIEDLISSESVHGTMMDAPDRAMPNRVNLDCQQT